MSESDRLSGESEVQSQAVCWNFVDVGVESVEEPLERGGGVMDPSSSSWCWVGGVKEGFPS